MKFRKIDKGRERRMNQRLEEIIPGEYVFINDIKEYSLSKKRSGVIYNISAGGCCLEIESLDEGVKKCLLSGEYKLVLEISLPIVKKLISVIAKVAWLSKLWKEEGKNEKYLMGLQFIDLITSAQDAIKDYIIKSYLEES